MNAFLEQLFVVNVVAAISILVVAIIRAPLRRGFGPHSAYGAWATVPFAILACCLPRSSISLPLAEPLQRLSLTSLSQSAYSTSLPNGSVLVGIWLFGMTAMSLLLTFRQVA